MEEVTKATLFQKKHWPYWGLLFVSVLFMAWSLWHFRAGNGDRYYRGRAHIIEAQQRYFALRMFESDHGAFPRHLNDPRLADYFSKSPGEFERFSIDEWEGHVFYDPDGENLMKIEYRKKGESQPTGVVVVTRDGSTRWEREKH